MKKLLEIVSAMSLIFTVIPTIVACENAEETPASEATGETPVDNNQEENNNDEISAISEEIEGDIIKRFFNGSRNWWCYI